MASAGTHKCPAPKCGVQVANMRFACRPHWLDLSDFARTAIVRTSRMNLLATARREAIGMAFEEWRARAN